MVLLVSAASMSSAASEETDCMAQYASGPAADTCTVQLTLNDTEADIVSSLKDKYRDFPLRCRIGKNFFPSISQLEKNCPRLH